MDMNGHELESKADVFVFVIPSEVEGSLNISGGL